VPGLNELACGDNQYINDVTARHNLTIYRK
jgi:hypothetical protein